MATAAVAMIVLRGGVSRLFFNLVGTFQASRLIHDAEAASIALQGLFVDALSGVIESAQELNQQIVEIEQAVIPIAREVEIATIEFEKFFDTTVITTNQLDEMARSVRAIGAEFGFVGDEALAAGGRAAQLQALYGPGVVEPLTRGGLALGFVGDMGGAEAQQALISLMQQNALVTGDLTQAQFALLSSYEQRDVVTASVADTLNKLNSVEDRSAARMPEIIEAMNHFGGVARLAGEDIGFMAAMTATLIERGIRAETAGTALRFTYARVGGDINGAGQALRDLGVATHDANGELRPMQQILNELAPAFNQMSDQQQQALAQTMAGNRHYARLLLLMQDLERANMLFNEAQQQTGKVMEENGEAAGYLADLFANTAFQIEQTEARISNLQAAIGERLLPAQLAALEAQEDMLITIEAMIGAFEGTGLGAFLEELYEARLVLMNIFAPFVQLYLNIYAAQIALSGFRQVMRAINGEQIAFIMGQQTNNAVTLAQEDLRAKKLTINNLKQQASAKLAQINARTSVLRNKLLDDRLKKNGVEVKQKQLVLLIDRQTALVALKKQKGQKSMLKLTQINKEIKNLEKEIEKQILNTKNAEAGTMKKINALEKEHLVLVDMIAHHTKDLVLLQERLTAEINQMNAELKEQGAILTGNQHALSGGVSGAMAFSGVAMIMSMILMVVGENINKILPKQIEFANNSEIMAVAMVMLAASFAPMIGQMIISIGLLTAKAGLVVGNIIKNTYLAASNFAVAVSEGGFLNSLRASIFALGAKLKVMGSAIVAAAGLALSNLTLTASEFAATTGATALAAALQAVFLTMIGILGLTGIGLALVLLAGAAMAAAKKLLPFNLEMQDTMTNMEDFADMDVPTFDTGFLDTYADGLNQATDAQEKFNNSREEMFFGFKAGNVQGALVKQIQQQGVETFIANTEVIQTNNFNGMTTREMANIVLDAIESEAGARGINLSGVSV